MGIHKIGVPVLRTEGYGGPEGNRRDIMGIEMINLIRAEAADQADRKLPIQRDCNANGVILGVFETQEFRL